MSIIIGLGYKAQSGKDTVADRIVKKNPFFKKSAFAGNLKKACQAIFGLSNEQLWGHDKARIDPFWGVAPREIMQRVGTECLRKNFRDDVWVKSLEHDIVSDYTRNHVITDVRFPNEAQAVKDWGGITVLVERNWLSSNPTGNKLDGKALKHDSETAMDAYDGWDYTIDNNGTLEELFDKIEGMLNWVDGEGHDLVARRTENSGG